MGQVGIDFRAALGRIGETETKGEGRTPLPF